MQSIATATKATIGPKDAPTRTPNRKSKLILFTANMSCFLTNIPYLLDIGN